MYVDEGKNAFKNRKKPTNTLRREKFGKTSNKLRKISTSE